MPNKLVQRIMAHMGSQDIANYIKFRSKGEDTPNWITSTPVEQRIQARDEFQQALLQVPTAILLDVIERLDRGEDLPDYNALMSRVTATAWEETTNSNATTGGTAPPPIIGVTGTVHSAIITPGYGGALAPDPSSSDFNC